VAWTAAPVIETDAGRWNLETTCLEMRSYLGLETTCGWTEQTVLRGAPCWFGLYSVVAALYVQLPARRRMGVAVAWVGKEEVTFFRGPQQCAAVAVGGRGFCNTRPCDSLFKKSAARSNSCCSPTWPPEA
jgi:hypothetical protein